MSGRSSASSSTSRGGRSGLAAALLDAAIEHASSRGATSLEAYPHATDRADYMGHAALFERGGFVPVRETSKRVVVRLDL